MKMPKTAIIIVCISLIAVAAVVGWSFIYTSDSITEQKALEKVKVLPEVQAFISELEEVGKTASFRVEDRGGAWSVQVYEIVVRGGESHTATFNWYDVDKNTGVISGEFEQ